MTYEDIKLWVGEPENKKKLVWTACLVVMFFVGFGTGKYQKPSRSEAQNVQSNYTTKKPEKPSPVATEAVVTVVAGTTTPANLVDCPVKGNIASGGKKTYHVKSGAFYERTKPEQCFDTEAEAKTAGYTKSQR